MTFEELKDYLIKCCIYKTKISLSSLLNTIKDSDIEIFDEKSITKNPSNHEIHKNCILSYIKDVYSLEFYDKDNMFETFAIYYKIVNNQIDIQAVLPHTDACEFITVTNNL